MNSPRSAGFTVGVTLAELPFKAVFRISGYIFAHRAVAYVTVRDGTFAGRGSASGVYYLDDFAAGVPAQIETHRQVIEAGITREDLRQLMPCGGARNALDCALWELEAQRSGKPVWMLAGLHAVRPLLTMFTLGVDEPAVTAEGARRLPDARALKLKLSGDVATDAQRVAAVRAARPDVWLGVDANQGFTLDTFVQLLPALTEARVQLVEQPLPRGHEADLDDFDCPIELAADESALGLADIEHLVGRFDVVNIKLDKCGGLTEGLHMAAAARRLGLRVMVGNMVGPSLAMAPAFVLGQQCDLVDLDGPTFLAADPAPHVLYQNGNIWCGDEVWGAPGRAAA